MKENKIIKKLFSREVIMYVIFGGFTTVVSILTYYLFRFCLSVQWSQILSWICAVTFAYVTNKIWVFESKQNTVVGLAKEILFFFSSRIFTGLVEFAAMSVMVRADTGKLTEMVIKALVTVMVIVLNYVFSKLLVFTKRG